MSPFGVRWITNQVASSFVSLTEFPPGRQHVVIGRRALDGDRSAHLGQRLRVPITAVENPAQHWTPIVDRATKYVVEVDAAAVHPAFQHRVIEQRVELPPDVRANQIFRFQADKLVAAPVTGAAVDLYFVL